MLGGGICRPRVNGLARVDERGACFVVVPIKYSVGVRHALIAPQSYDVRVHVYTYSKHASPNKTPALAQEWAVWSDTT